MSIDQQELDVIAADCRGAIDTSERITFSDATAEARARAYAHIQGYAEAMRDIAEDVAARASAFRAGFDRAAFYRQCGLNEHGYYTED